MALGKVAEHHLGSKHEIVPEDKVQEVIVKFGTKGVEGFPKMLKDDPAVSEIGAKRGDIIKITRHSSTAGTAIYFRVVM